MPAPPLTSTYRLQLHAGFTFDDACAVVPYVARLGVSHLYLSPVLAARPGSMHGYDIVDPRIANPELGGEAGFRAFAAAAHAHGLGVVLDIVPNHMGIGAANPFWMDVLRRGRESPYARVFDIEWDVPGREGTLLLPVLGDELDAVLARDEIRLAWCDGELRATYYEHEWPLDPATIGGAPIELPSGIEGRERLRALLDRQHWRLAHWRRGAREMNYRRFFDIGELAAVRAEDPAVFDVTHAWILDRVADGSVDGLRVDHVDGLRDPQAYLERLRAEVDARRPNESVPIFVEKVLASGEALNGVWPVDGTTGYEFLNDLEAVFVDPGGAALIEAAYRRTLRIGTRAGFREVAARGKELVLRRAFDTDVRRLVRLIAVAARGVAPRMPRSMLHEAVVQMTVALGVYRTYVRLTDADGETALATSADDFRWIGEALATAQQHGAGDRFALQFVADVLRGEWPAPGVASERAHRAARDFALRFQQTSGPATAKGVEDTALYRWFPLASLGDVGGDPARDVSNAVETLHAANGERSRRWPRQLVTVETHDTKRSADVRARLDALSEIADEWVGLVARWRRRRTPLRPIVAHRAVPDANAEYLLYQTLVGVWPAGGAPNAEGRAELRERVTTYMRKAAREAKAQTSWTDADAPYEQALVGFIEALVEGEPGAPFRAELDTLVARVGRGAMWTSLSRTLILAASPGTPDVYQGGELWSLALVDPDNRRAVDFGRRRDLLDALGDVDPTPDAAGRLVADVVDGRLKLYVLRVMLRLRRADPELFSAGEYHPLTATGGRAAHAISFARTIAERGVAVVAPRLPLALRPDGGAPIGPAAWDDTEIRLPSGVARCVDVLTGVTHATPNGTLPLAAALAKLPVACVRW